MNKYSFVISIFILAANLAPQKCRAELTKTGALELLKQGGYKWQQTYLLSMDAQAKTAAVASLFSLHSSIFSREYVGKVNQIQYGFSDPGTLTWFTAGTTGIDFTYTVFDSAANARYEASRTNERLSGKTAIQYQSDLTYVMLLSFLNVQRLSQNLIVINANIKKDTEIVEMAKTRVRTGTGVTLDILRAEGLLEHERFRQLDAKTNYFKARKDLANLLGKPDLDGELEPLVLKIIPLPGNHSSNEIDNRPDIQVAAIAVELAQQWKHELERQSLPKLGIFGDVGAFGTHVIGGVGNAITGTLGVQLSLPLTSGGLNAALVQEQNVKVINTTMQQKQARLDADSQIEVSVSQLKDAQTAIDVSNRQIEIAKLELGLSEKKMQSGISASLDVTNAIVNMASAQDANVQAIVAYEAAKIGYYRATGELDKYFQLESEKK